jgi:ankyrin repeat protein
MIETYDYAPPATSFLISANSVFGSSEKCSSLPARLYQYRLLSGWIKKHVLSGANLNALSGGELPLCLALRKSNLEAIRYLLRKKLDLGTKQANGETALHIST